MCPEASAALPTGHVGDHRRGFIRRNVLTFSLYSNRVLDSYVNSNASFVFNCNVFLKLSSQSSLSGHCSPIMFSSEVEVHSKKCFWAFL